MILLIVIILKKETDVIYLYFFGVNNIDITWILNNISILYFVVNSNLFKSSWTCCLYAHSELYERICAHVVLLHIAWIMHTTKLSVDARLDLSLSYQNCHLKISNHEPTTVQILTVQYIFPNKFPYILSNILVVFISFFSPI